MFKTSEHKVMNMPVSVYFKVISDHPLLGLFCVNVQRTTTIIEMFLPEVY